MSKVSVRACNEGVQEEERPKESSAGLVFMWWWEVVRGKKMKHTV